MSRTLLLVILAIILLVIMGMIFKFSIKKPPLEETRIAREYLGRAQRLNSGLFANELYCLGELHYKMAMELWDIENEKFITFRRFEEISTHALKSIDYSKKAIEISQAKREKTADYLKLRISALERKIKVFNSNFGNFPLEEGDRKELAQSGFLLSEGSKALKQFDFQVAEMKLDSAEILVNSLTSKYNAIAKAYFQDFEEWKKWFQQSIHQSSAKSSECIIVDKFARKCMLYSKGNLKYTFDIELGKNWIGDKMHQGDMTTPEGHYKVLLKKSGAATRYHKALLLDYPNESDRKRFNLNKKSGQIDESVAIGGMIEIHGGGGKGFDWTEGCIALKDRDMDLLFANAKKGTPVVIAGSLKSFEEIIK